MYHAVPIIIIKLKKTDGTTIIIIIEALYKRHKEDEDFLYIFTADNIRDVKRNRGDEGQHEVCTFRQSFRKY